MQLTAALTSFLVMGSLVYKAAQILVARIFPKNDAPAWVPQVITLALAIGASFLFQLNVLPAIAPTFGGHLATVPLWAAMLLTGIALAAIAEGAVTTFQAVVSAKAGPVLQSIAKNLPRFW